MHPQDPSFESGCRAKLDFVKIDLYVSLNWIVRVRRPTILDDDEDDEEEAISCKRRRTSTSTLPFFKKSNSLARRHIKSKGIEISPCSIEKLDLELKLGDCSKVK